MKKLLLSVLIASSCVYAADSNSSLTLGDIFNVFSPSKDTTTAPKQDLAQPASAQPDDSNGSLTPQKIYNFFRGNKQAPAENNGSLKAAPLSAENNLSTYVAPMPKDALDFNPPSIHQPIQKQILSISPDGKSALIDSSDLRRGISGFVWQQLDDSHRMLVARTYISSIKGDKAKIRFTVLEDTAQEALPTVLNRPKVGDNVIFYMLEDKGFIIAPTQTDYQNAIWALPTGLKIVHPDIFASFLTTMRSAEPKESQFRAFCANSQLTNAYFVLSDGIYKTDCFTLVILEKYPFTASNEPAQLPFFNRIGEIPTGYFGMFKDEIKNYDSYYRGLLGLKK